MRRIFFWELILSAGLVWSQAPTGRATRPADHRRERQEFFLRARQSFDNLPPAIHLYRALRQRGQIPFAPYPIARPRDGASRLGAAPVVTSGSWSFLGPAPELDSYYGYVGGRVTAIALDPNDATGNTVYVGTAYGGVWKSTNALSANPTFTPISDPTQSLSVGAIAVIPGTSPSTILVGTGEPNDSGDSYYGMGILRSTDGGQTWSLITQDDTCQSVTCPLQFIGMGWSAILVDPVNPSIVLAAASNATNFHTTSSSVLFNTNGTYRFGGVYRSLDGGATWTQAFGGSGDNCDSLVYDPGSKTYYTVISGTMYKSTDQGNSWTQINGPMPSGTGSVGRVALADRAGVLYALTSDSSGNLSVGVACSSGQTTGCDTGLSMSSDGGTTWVPLAAPAGLFGSNHQGYYDIWIAAPPNASSLLVGGIDAWQASSVNSTSTTWSNLTNSYTNGIVHPDQHAFATETVGGNTTWFVGNDGGVWSSTDSGAVWSDLNASLSALQFYSIAGNPRIAGEIMGGTQDNGTEYTTGSVGWKEFFGGDGGNSAFDTAGDCFFSYTHADVYYSSGCSGGYNPILNLPPNSQFIAPYQLEPADNSTMLFGGDAVYRGPAMPASINTGWSAISPVMNAGCAQYSYDCITAVASAPGNANYIYAAAGFTSDSSISVMYTANALSSSPTWTTYSFVNSGLSLAFGPISSISVHPTNPQIAYLALQGFGGSHVLMTTDGGANWVDITGNLPDAPANWVAIDPQAAENIYVATDVGVFVATDGGAAGAAETWKQLGSGLPNTAILQLAFDNTGSYQLLAATHGRGVWSIAPLPASAPLVALSPAALTFASQPTGITSAAQTVTLTNTGTASLSITSIAASGDFAETNTCNSSVAAGANCAISVTFTPTATGARTGALTITDNASGSPQSVSLSGTATLAAPLAGVSPASLSFSGQIVSTTSAAQTITLSNPGSATLTIGGIGISGDFAQTSTCGSSLAAGANCSISVTFTPSASGTRSGTLTITDNAANSPQSVSLSGTGQDLQFGPASGASSSATVTAGSTATYNLALTPEGGLSGTVTVSCTGAPTQATCTASPASVTLSNSATSIAVSVSTTARSLLPPAFPLVPPRLPWMFYALGALACALGLAWLADRKRRWLALCAGALLALSLAGCGGGTTASTPSAPAGTPAGTYTLTVTAANSSISRSTSLSLTVQ